MPSLTQRLRGRKGCKVCGFQGVGSDTCCPSVLVDPREHVVVVDGGFSSMDSRRRYGMHEMGHGGAGLVIVRCRDGEVIATRSCGFECADSAMAEREAILRGARFAPRLAVLTDSESHACDVARREWNVAIEYVPRERRTSHFDLAHHLARVGLERVEYAWIRREISSLDDQEAPSP